MKWNGKLVGVMLIITLCFGAFGCAAAPAPLQTAESTTLSPTDASGYLVLPEGEFVYNTEVNQTFVSYKEPSVQFEEALDANEIAAVIPDDRFPCTGTARWDGAGNLIWINLEVMIGEETVTVYYPFAYYAMGSPVVNISDPKPTELNDHSFAVADFAYGKNTSILQATCVVEDQRIVVNTFFKNDSREEIQPAFEMVVRWVSLMQEKPDFSVVQYSAIPKTQDDAGQ